MAGAEGLGTIIEVLGLVDALKNDRAWLSSVHAFQEALLFTSMAKVFLQKVRKYESSNFSNC